MNFIKTILFFFFLGAISLSAQETSSSKIEFGVSLLSLTREYEARNVGRYRSPYFGLLNGYIFKYHRPKNGAFRLRFRIIGQQSMGGFTEAFDGIQLGDNFDDIGFEILAGYQSYINRKGKRWKYYFGTDFGFIRNKDNRRNNEFFIDRVEENKYYGIRINPLLGIKLRASKYFAFSLESNWAAGIINYSQISFPKSGSEFEFYFNPVSILSATFTIPRQEK